MNQEIARQGILPYSHLLSSSRPFNSPLGGLMLHFVPSFLVITLPPRNVYSFTLEVEGWPGQFFALATAIGLIWLRWKRPELKRPFKAFLPAVWLRALLSIALISAPLIPKAGVTWKRHLETTAYAFVGLGLYVWHICEVLESLTSNILVVSPSDLATGTFGLLLYQDGRDTM